MFKFLFFTITNLTLLFPLPLLNQGLNRISKKKSIQYSVLNKCSIFSPGQKDIKAAHRHSLRLGK